MRKIKIVSRISSKPVGQSNLNFELIKFIKKFTDLQRISFVFVELKVDTIFCFVVSL